MTREEAEGLAIRALGWLAGQEELWPCFLNATGVAVGDLRSAAADPGFLAAVLEYLTQYDGWVTAFCDSEGIDYLRPLMALRLLSPETDINWT